MVITIKSFIKSLLGINKKPSEQSKKPEVNYNQPEFIEKRFTTVFDKLTTMNKVFTKVESNYSVWLFDHKDTERKLFVEQLRDKFANNYVFTYLDLNSEILRNERRFWYYFMISTLQQNDNEELPLVFDYNLETNTSPFDPVSDIYCVLEDWLDEAFDRQKSDKKLLVCVDSFDDINTAIEQRNLDPERFLSELRHIIQSDFAINLIYFSSEQELLAKYSHYLINLISLPLTEES